jgi:hypothetical protein
MQQNKYKAVEEIEEAIIVSLLKNGYETDEALNLRHKIVEYFCILEKE